MEVMLIFIINQTIMEDSLTFMAEESEDLYFFSYCSWVTLKNTCFFRKGEKKKLYNCGISSDNLINEKSVSSALSHAKENG